MFGILDIQDRVPTHDSARKWEDTTAHAKEAAVSQESMSFILRIQDEYYTQ